MPNLVYISLGSNVGNREAYLSYAITWLKTEGRIVSLSSFYETEPVEFTNQEWFLNCAAALETNKTPQELMAAMLKIEQSMGRRRTHEKGPRIIDLDILLCGDMIINAPGLIVPHPALHNRRFVLEPLAEIAPHLQHPVFKKTIQSLLDSLPSGQTVRKIAQR